MTKERMKNIPKSGTPKAQGKKVFIIGGAVALILVAGGITYYFLRKRDKKNPSFWGKWETSKNANIPSKSSANPFRCTSQSYPLIFSTCHPDVVVLQRYLKHKYKADLGTYGKNKDGIDGKYGRKTQEAARAKLQKDAFHENDIASMKAALKKMGQK